MHDNEQLVYSENWILNWSVTQITYGLGVSFFSIFKQLHELESDMPFTVCQSEQNHIYSVCLSLCLQKTILHDYCCLFSCLAK